MRNSFNEKTQKKILSLLSEIAQTDGELPRLKKALAVGLYQTAEPLQKTRLTRESWSHYFPEGTVQSPIETVRMGEHQFEKLQRSDRNHLLDGVYKTLINPSIILNTQTFDEKENKIKPVHIYGKAFYSLTSEASRIVKSVVVFKQGKSISISSHQNDILEFLKHLNSIQDLSYTSKTLVEKTSVILKEAGSGVDLRHINTRPINLAYDEKNLLNEISFAQETKTVGTNPDRVTPLDLTKGGSHARHQETVRDRVSTLRIKEYTENGNLSRENSAFTQETKTAGENLRPSDSAAQNEVGSPSRHPETVRDRVSAFAIKYTENGSLSRENSAFAQETKTAGTNPDRVTPLDLTKGGSPSRHPETVRDRVSAFAIKYTENGSLSSGETVLEKFMEENGIKTAKAEKTNVRGKNQDMEL